MDLEKTLQKINEPRYITEACFVFSCFNDTDLFDDYLDPNNPVDLRNPDAKFYWQLGTSMYESGIHNIDAVSIEEFLSNKPKAKKQYEKFGGYQTVDELRNIVNPENADAYFDKIQRMNALSTMAEKCDDVFNHVERFDNASSSDVYDAFELLNNSVAISSNRDSKIENLIITKEFIDNCQSGENVGLQYGKNCPLLNYTTLGAPLSDVYLLAGHSGSGKALALDEPILTPTGFKPMRDIKLGDYVIGEDGKKTQVIGVFPQGKRPAYRVTFENGTQIICDAEHNWKIKHIKDEKKGKDWSVKTTKEMFDMKPINSQGQRKFRIPICQPIQDFVSKKDLLIPPYTLGALLGDGYICQHEIQFTTTEQDIVDRINQDVFKWGSFDQTKHSPIQFMYHTKLSKGNNKLLENLKSLNLYGCKSDTKFIPKEYLYSSYENRLALAQGLIDTDGHVNPKGHVSYSTVSKQLAEDAAFLFKSLGKQVRVKISDRRKSGRKNLEYEVYICGLNPDLFSSKKHKNNYDNKIFTTREYYYHHLRITDIEELNEEVEMQCIAVDNESHTYLCRDFVVTHNTSFVVENMVIPISEHTPVAIFSNEMKMDVYQNMLLVHILTKDLNYWQLTRKKIKIGNYTDEDKEMIAKAMEISTTRYTNIKFVKLFDNNTSTIMKYMKKLAHQGVKCFIWDTFKGDDISDGGDAWFQLLMNSRKVFNLVSKLNVSLICTFQLALYTTNQRYLDASCLSSSKQIKEVVSELVMIRRLWSDEYTGKRNDCKAYRIDKETKKKIMLELEEDKAYYVAFINKTRNDESNKEILYKWDSQWNKWVEMGFCTIQNDHRGG